MRCRITIPFLDHRTAESVFGAVLPEMGAVPSTRTRVDMERKRNEIVLLLDSEDVSSMRAAINSYLRWLLLARRLTECGGDD